MIFFAAKIFRDPLFGMKIFHDPLKKLQIFRGAQIHPAPGGYIIYVSSLMCLLKLTRTVFMVIQAD